MAGADLQLNNTPLRLQVSEVYLSNWPQDTHHVPVKDCQPIHKSRITESCLRILRPLSQEVRSPTYCEAMAQIKWVMCWGAVDVNFFFSLGYYNPGRNILPLCCSSG